jgi:hypothetical protein
VEVLLAQGDQAAVEQVHHLEQQEAQAPQTLAQVVAAVLEQQQVQVAQVGQA